MNNIIHVDANMRRIDKNRQDVKPEVPSFSFPEAFERIRGEKRWCSWKWVLSESGRWTKPPMRALNEAFSSSTNPDTWDTLEAVRLRAETEPGERGVGLMLKGLPLLGVIDLDNCVDQEGNLAGWADDVVRRCGSYTEASPSGTGVKIYGFVKSRDSLSCKVVRGGCEVELFLNTARYVCVTGKQVGDFGFLSDITEVFEQLATPQTENKKSEGKKGDQTFILMDPEGIRKALSYVDANNYHKWILMGYALKSYGDEGKALWDEFSKRSSKFHQKRNDEEWAGFAPHTVDTGRIIYEAEQNGFVNDFSWLNKADEVFDLPRLFNVSDEVENQPKEYVINNFIRTGTFAFAGQPGGGKSTVLATLATAVSGLLLQPHETIQVYLRRRVLWFAEAPEQITDILKVMRENGVLEPDQGVVRDMIKVYYSRRAGPEFWDKALPALLEGREYRNTVDGGEYDARPLIVFDTTSANFEIESENDNSEVSRLIANVRRVLRGYPVWLIAHTAKAARDVSVFDLDARGASAWKGDVEGTAAIGRETADGLRDFRFLRFQKRRYSAQYDWIIAERKTYETQHRVLGAPGGVETSYVDTVDIRLVRESEGIEFVEAAREAVAERQLEAREQAVMTALQDAANATRGEGFEGLVVRIQAGRQAEGPIEGYEKLKRVTMEQLRDMARITSRKTEVKEWFKQVIGRLFEVNGDVDVPGCIVAVRAQNFEFGGN